MILRECLAATAPDPATHWVDAIRALFEPIGGLDLPEIGREPVGEPAVFQEQKRPR